LSCQPPWPKTLPFHFDCFDVVASVAVVGLKLWIEANARDGLNQLHRLAAAEARDWTPGFVFGLFSGSHAAKIRLKSICFSIRMREPSSNTNSNTPRYDKKGPLDGDP
jgi:hypothetical protein